MTQHSDVDPQLITSPGSSAVRETPMSDYRGHVRTVVENTLDRADKSLKERFRGVTIGDDLRTDLFPLAATGVSLEPVVAAAQRFLATLSTNDRQTVSFAVDDDVSWRSWHNMHFFLMRHGLAMHEMRRDTRDAALDMLRATMSVEGFANARDVMRLNGHAAEISGRHEEYGEYYYWISLFGTPSTSEPWGWQIDGHHLIVNAFMIDDQLVMTPDFRGSEPVRATTGTHAGTAVFAQEEAAGLSLFQSFDGRQRKIATVSDAPPREVVTTAQVDNLAIDDVGLEFSQLTGVQQGQLLDVIRLYTDRIRSGHAGAKLEQIKRHRNETKFAWMGSAEEDGAFYYRITNPVILIEFDHLPGILYNNREPTRRHVHTIVRTPNGNDYGRSLLADHYRRHDHADPQSAHRGHTPEGEPSSSHNHREER